MISLRNKKGDGKYISIYWFFMIILVATGIFLMNYIFYGAPYDFRKIEARVLTNQIFDCVSYGGRLNSSLVSNGEFLSTNFLENCHLIFTSPEEEVEQYYAGIEFYKLQDLNSPAFTLRTGNLNFASNCEIQEGNPLKNQISCLKTTFYSIDDENNQYIIKILTGVNKNVK